MDNRKKGMVIIGIFFFLALIFVGLGMFAPLGTLKGLVLKLSFVFFGISLMFGIAMHRTRR